jgi:hypothetical protein
LIASLMLKVHIQNWVIVSCIETLATEFRNSSSLYGQDIWDLLFVTSLAHFSP